jgi:hypothetical protein
MTVASVVVVVVVASQAGPVVACLEELRLGGRERNVPAPLGGHVGVIAGCPRPR